MDTGRVDTDRGRSGYPNSVGAFLSVVLWLVVGAATAVADDGGHDLATAQRLHAEVIDLFAAGRATEALPLARRELTIVEQLFGSDDVATALALNTLGQVLEDTGDLEEARACHERALQIRIEQLGTEHAKTADSHNNLGAVLEALGDREAALRHYARALVIREKVYGSKHPKVATICHNLGTLMIRLGQTEAAIALLSRTLAINEGLHEGDHPSLCPTLDSLGTLSRFLGEYEAAKKLFWRSLQIREASFGPEHPETAISLGRLCWLYTSGGEYRQARQYCERAFQITSSRFGPDHPDTLHSVSALLRVAAATGDGERVLSLGEQVLTAQEQTLTTVLAVGSDDERLRYLDTLDGVGELIISHHLHAAPDDPRAAALALTTILQRKGRSLDATVAAQESIPRDTNGRVVALQAALAEHRKRRAFWSLRPPVGSSIEQRQTKIEEHDREIRDLEHELSHYCVTLDLQGEPVTIEAVRARLPAGTALVEIFRYNPYDPDARGNPWGDSRYVAYVLQSAGPVQWAELGSAEEIGRGVEAFRSAIAGRTLDVIEKAEKLDQLTMAKVRHLLGTTTTLVLSPDGELLLVPFAALVDETGHYLIERYHISYLTSGRDLLRRASDLASRQEPLLVGDPTFGDSDPAGRFPALSGTAAEVRAIGSLLGLPETRILTGEKASEAAVKAVTGPSILHLATHGAFEPAEDSEPREWPLDALESPWQHGDWMSRSLLALAGANRQHMVPEMEDGLLTALEVTGLDLRGTELVVLSACETGVGEVKAGEGVFGLRRALVLAGSRIQVMSLWQVHDTTTSDLMVSFYRQLKAGSSPAEAMRLVQSAALAGKPLPVIDQQLRGGTFLLPEGDPRLAGTRHPYYWAGFIVSGDTEVQTTTTRDGP